MERQQLHGFLLAQEGHLRLSRSQWMGPMTRCMTWVGNHNHQRCKWYHLTKWLASNHLAQGAVQSLFLSTEAGSHWNRLPPVRWFVLMFSFEDSVKETIWNGSRKFVLQEWLEIETQKIETYRLSTLLMQVCFHFSKLTSVLESLSGELLYPPVTRSTCGLECSANHQLLNFALLFSDLVWVEYGGLRKPFSGLSIHKRYSAGWF